MISIRSGTLGSGGELLARTLESLGVRLILSIPGSQVLPVLDSSPLRSGRMRLVVPRSERSAAFVAEGFGKASGAPAVVMSTLGPGTANELPGIHSAARSRSPLLSVAPFQPPRKRGRIAEVFQGLDQPAFFREACKRCFLIETRRELRPLLESAFEACTSGPPGPVHVDVSFPLLFSTGVFVNPPVRRVPAPAEKAEPILVETRKTARRSSGPVRTLAPGEACGIVPFSLGVVLAAPGSRVLTKTGTDALELSLDTLATARTIGLMPRIAAGSRNLRAKAVAEAFGFPMEAARSKKRSRPAEGAGWTIDVSGT